MKLKKIIIILLVIVLTSGCKKVNDLSYTEIVDMISYKENSANTYRNGYKFYLPKGLTVVDAGSNYATLENNYNDRYYVYFDLTEYINKSVENYNVDNSLEYSKAIDYNGKKGYVQIKKIENNKDLIEIMYNYAKIEVMVDNSNVKNVLVNSISILRSIKYDDNNIKNILNDDKSVSKEEYFDIFESANKKSNVLDYFDGDDTTDIDN